MKLCLTTLLFCLVASGFAFQLSDVLKFEPHHNDFDSNVQDLMELLGKNHILGRYISDEQYSKFGFDSKMKLKEYKFKNCGTPTNESMVLTALQISPDPIKLGNKIKVSFNLTVKKEVAKPVKADIKLYKKIADFDLKVPCIDNVGSCIYEDVCDMLSKITQCPQPFISSRVPCKCPFKPGNYKMKDGEFQLPSLPLPEGDYKVVANLTTNGDSVGCYEVELSLTNS